MQGDFQKLKNHRIETKKIFRKQELQVQIFPGFRTGVSHFPKCCNFSIGWIGNVPYFIENAGYLHYPGGTPISDLYCQNQDNFHVFKYLYFWHNRCSRLSGRTRDIISGRRCRGFLFPSGQQWQRSIHLGFKGILYIDLISHRHDHAPGLTSAWSAGRSLAHCNLGGPYFVFSTMLRLPVVSGGFGHGGRQRVVTEYMTVKGLKDFEKFVVTFFYALASG